MLFKSSFFEFNKWKQLKSVVFITDKCYLLPTLKVSMLQVIIS